MGPPGLSVTRIPEVVESTARTQPELVAGAAIGALALLALVIVLVRRIRRTDADRLVGALSRADGVAILMHPNPDPDAMGTAMGISELAEAQGTPATIYYAGQIRHQENRAFRNVLELDLVEMNDADTIAEETVVLVDQNEPRGFRGAERIDADIVIDHHPGEGTGSTFTDVRPHYGACASIVAEYFQTLDADRSDGAADRTDGGTVTEGGPLELSDRIATGLMYGIQADTDHLTKGCTAAEFEASSYLYPSIDADLLHRIANPQVTRTVLETKARAIRDRKINGSFAVADVGDVDDLDAIPQAADELVRLEGISAVVIYGSKDEAIHLSGRSIDDRVHMGRTLEAVFDDVPMASAGGHARMGGGQVPLSYLAGIGPNGVDEDRARSELRGQLFNALKGNR